MPEDAEISATEETVNKGKGSGILTEKFKKLLCTLILVHFHWH
jgi:hypothetical protein